MEDDGGGWRGEERVVCGVKFYCAELVWLGARGAECGRWRHKVRDGGNIKSRNVQIITRMDCVLAEIWINFGVVKKHPAVALIIIEINDD